MERFWRRAALAVAIHDLGKCCGGFQEVLRGRGEFRHRHEVLSVVFLPWVLGKDPEEDGGWVAAAVLSHHKDLSEINERYRAGDAVLGIGDELNALGGELSREFYAAGTELFRERIWPRLEASGLGSREWGEAVQNSWEPEDGVGELRRVVDQGLRIWQRIRKLPYNWGGALGGRFLRGVLVLADHAGSAWEKFGAAPELRSREEMANRLGLKAAQLYGHQVEVGGVEGSAVLMAPTGSGKTEAGMLWAARQGSSVEGGVLFYVLPYQASLNAMRRRLGDALGGEEKVGLQHSRALQALYRQLLERGYEPKRAQGTAKREVALSRLHATPVRILTPYQLLRGAFQLKGHEALWTDAASGLMILDEIHAYEAARLGMILATLSHMTRDLGVRALVMSATLPSRLLGVVREVLGEPRVVVAKKETLEAFRRHRVHLVDGELLEEENLRRAAEDAARGLAVLVVATTVGRAQEAWRKLREMTGGTVELLHGRFHAEDRLGKESWLLEQRGKTGNSAVVLVATQVVEVSLDVDFDVLYSDPAPLEALLQRFGRVNRRRREPLREVYVMRGIPEGCPVYEESLVLAGLDQLGWVDGEGLEEGAIQGVLDAVYSGERGERWEAELREATRNFERRILSALRPFESDDRIEEQFEKLFDGCEVLPRCEEERYRGLQESEPLLAPSLLVPVTLGQFHGMRRSGALKQEEGVWVADRPYSREEGLDVRGDLRVDGV
jgi:CRISPR-associated endonuclease/helicase Cas3